MRDFLLFARAFSIAAGAILAILAVLAAFAIGFAAVIVIVFECFEIHSSIWPVATAIMVAWGVATWALLSTAPDPREREMDTARAMGRSIVGDEEW